MMDEWKQIVTIEFGLISNRITTSSSLPSNKRGSRALFNIQIYSRKQAESNQVELNQVGVEVEVKTCLDIGDAFFGFKIL